MTFFVRVYLSSIITRQNSVSSAVSLRWLLKIYQFVWIRIFTTTFIGWTVDLAFVAIFLSNIFDNLTDLRIFAESLLFHIVSYLIHKATREVNDLNMKIFILLRKFYLFLFFLAFPIKIEVLNQSLIGHVLSSEEGALLLII